MKKYFILIILIAVASKLFPQCVSIELSIYWKNEKSIITTKDSIICQPYLNITYRNNSKTPLYFLKVSQGGKGLPYIPYSSAIKLKETKRCVSYDNYMGENFKIELYSQPYYLSGWEVLPDTCNLNSEHEIHAINDDLASIYEFISFENFGKIELIEEVKTYFTPMDVTQFGILNIVNDRFVFLKPEEFYVDTYNLVGFKMIGGNYTFSVFKEQFGDYVYSEPIWNKQTQKWIFKKIKLPPKVERYSLYGGKFYSNEVTVMFKSR